MSKEEILERVIEICKDVFDNDDLELSVESCADEVEEWDSLAHLSLISDLEDEFDIKFSFDEISNSKKIGELVNVIIRNL